MRIPVTLICTECKSKNYYSSKNKANTTSKIEMKKYCKKDKKHTLHKEGK